MNCQHLFFLRHLQTEHNVNVCINGQSVGLPVLEIRSIIGARNVDTVYCSPALRCRQTMACFLKTNIVQTVVYSNMLLERDMGILEGEKRDIAAVHYPELFERKQFHIFKTPPSGESFSGDVLICSHNQFLKALYFTVSKEQITEKAWKSLSFPFGEMIPINF